MSTIFDRNLLPEFEAVKDNDENFIWIGKPELKSFLANMLIAGIIGIGIVVAIVMFNLHQLKENENSNRLTAIMVSVLQILVGSSEKYQLPLV